MANDLAQNNASGMTNGATNGSAVPHPAELDASKLVINPAKTLKDVPPDAELVFGQFKSDHMLVVEYDPIHGWSAPEIKPYGPLEIDPASSCLQYATNVFEGMKAYMGPDGKPRLFRPDKNMARMAISRARVALPAFDTDVFLQLIKRLVTTEHRWIPKAPGCSLYLRPTIIGTRPSFGVRASDYATLYVICCPTGPFFATGIKPISLLAIDEHVRSWPGGTGGYKLALNYAPTFQPQALAASAGYDQCLWLLGEKITEAGAMNFFVVVKREDGDLDVFTPPLDGTILPGVTRDSVLALAEAHPSRTILPHLSPNLRLHAHERDLTMSDLATWSSEGKLVEVFTAGTAVIVLPVGRIGYGGKDLVFPEYEGCLGPVGRAMYDRISDIQYGRVEWENWSVKCE